MTINVEIGKDALNAVYKAMNAIKAENISIRVSQEGWEIAQTDPSRIAMVHIIIPRAAFDRYECADCEIAIPVKTYKAMLGVMGDEVAITVDERFTMTMTSGTIKRTCRTIEPDAHIKIPNPELPIKASIETDALRRVIAASDYTDVISISASQAGLRFATVGDTDATELDYPIQGLPEGRSQYPLIEVKAIIDALPSPLFIEYAPDYPIRMISDMRYRTEFMLAPRVEDRAG